MWLWLCSRVVWRRDGQREGEGKGEGERLFLVKVSGLSRWGSLEMGPCWKDGKCPKPWFIAKASITLRARVCVCLQWRHPISPQAVTGWQAGAVEEQCFYFSRRSDGLPRRGWGCPLNGRCHAGRCAHGMWIWGCLLPARCSAAAEGAAWLDSRAPAEHISCFWYFFLFLPLFHVQRLELKFHFNHSLLYIAVPCCCLSLHCCLKQVNWRELLWETGRWAITINMGQSQLMVLYQLQELNIALQH